MLPYVQANLKSLLDLRKAFEQEGGTKQDSGGSSSSSTSHSSSHSHHVETMEDLLVMFEDAVNNKTDLANHHLFSLDAKPMRMRYYI